MRSVNNKYLIENEIDNEENFSNYIVLDSEENIKYVLYILKNNFTYEKTREYLLNKFKTLKNLNFDNIINLIDIQIIYSIDGMKLDKPLYGYLTEYVDSNILDTEYYLEQCTAYEKMDIFMEICSAINTLNIKGYIFDEITIKDIILISDLNNRIKIKIKNLLEYEISKFRISNLVSKNSLYYLYDTKKQEEDGIAKDNIVKVIEIFNSLFNQVVENEFKELRDINKIFTQINASNKPYKLKQFIKYISEKMHRNYMLFDYNALNRIETNLDIIGMDDELQKVEKGFQRILENKEKYKIIGFNGQEGSGKSRLLKEIKYKMENKYFKNIIYIPNLKDLDMDTEDIFNEMLSCIYQKLDRNLREKYEIHIKKFIEILLEKNTEYNEIINNQRLQLINRMSKFMYEFTIAEPLIILIDDLEEQNDTFKLFIRYIAFLGNNLENVMIIFSMNESKCNDDFLELIKEFKTLKQYEEYKINYFNQYYTTTMVKAMLNPGKSINKLAIKIYSETLGSPKFIREVIKELYVNKMLYFSKENVEWKTRINVRDIVIPKNLEKSLEISINRLNKEELTVLERLSIFEAPLSEKILLNYIFTEPISAKVYNNLKLKGVLIEKISDEGMLIDFSNNLLKNVLYTRVNRERKFKMHVEASIFFEEILFETDYYMDEFLMHLEKSKNTEKIYLYTLRCAKVAEIYGNTFKAIGYYKKALRYSSDKNNGKIAINIAKIYQRIDEEERSYKYFGKANEFAVQNNDRKLQIYALIEMIIIKIKEATNIDLDYPLIIVRQLLNETPYIVGEIYYYYAFALKSKLEYEPEITLINATKALIMCEENKINDDIYGWIKLLISDIYIRQNRFQQAEMLLISASDNFSENNNNNGYLLSKLRYTSVCEENGKSITEVLNEYLDINRLSNKYKMYKKEILSLICIGEIYIDQREYKKAEDYLLLALEREREQGIDLYSAKICNYLCLVYIKLGKVKLSTKYYYLTKQIQCGFKLSEEDLIKFNITSASYNLLICNYSEAMIYLEDIYKLTYDMENKFKKIICNYYEIMLYRCKSEEEIRLIYCKLNLQIEQLGDSRSQIGFRVSSIKRILDLGYKDFARELFLHHKLYPKDYDVEANYIYLEFNFRYENYYNTLINKALRICVFISNKEVKADLYAVIGEKYNQVRCHMLAMNYYYESISLHIDIINSLPENDQLQYINNSRFLKTSKLFINCLNNDLKVNIKFTKLKVIDDASKINKVINEFKLANLLENGEMYKLVQDLYEKLYYNDFNDIYRVFERITSNTVSNLEYLVKYIARMTLANKAMLVIENTTGENDVICAYRISDKNEINRYFSLKVDSGEDALLICNNDDRFNQLDERILRDGLKSCIYLKLRSKGDDGNNNGAMNARLILISDNAINNINSESKKIIEKCIPFLMILLEQYKLTINSTLDKLTGVYNRRYFENSLTALIDSSNMEKNQFAVMMFDIDDFKSVNDKYGHQKGDEVLIKLSNEVKMCISKSDIIGRYGGEEFIVILPKMDKIQALSIAEKIRSKVENAKILGDKMNVTISIGLAMYTREQLTYEEIINRADQALYMAKYKGKNRCEIWENDCCIVSNINNELTGILSGNINKDYNITSILKDVIDLVKCKLPVEEKIYKFLTRVMQVIECERSTVFIVKENHIINVYSKKRGNDGWDISDNFNMKAVYEAIENESGKYMVDWDNIYNNNRYGIPDWKSICVTPIIYNGYIIAILYLEVSVNEKEFTFNDYKILNCFGEMGTSIFYEKIST